MGEKTISKGVIPIECPLCHSLQTTRFQWVDNYYFEYWTCWGCDYIFTIDIPQIDIDQSRRWEDKHPDETRELEKPCGFHPKSTISVRMNVIGGETIIQLAQLFGELLEKYEDLKEFTMYDPEVEGFKERFCKIVADNTIWEKPDASKS